MAERVCFLMILVLCIIDLVLGHIDTGHETRSCLARTRMRELPHVLQAVEGVFIATEKYQNKSRGVQGEESGGQIMMLL